LATLRRPPRKYR